MEHEVRDAKSCLSLLGPHWYLDQVFFLQYFLWSTVAPFYLTEGYSPLFSDDWSILLLSMWWEVSSLSAYSGSGNGFFLLEFHRMWSMDHLPQNLLGSVLKCLGPISDPLNQILSGMSGEYALETIATGNLTLKDDSLLFPVPQIEVELPASSLVAVLKVW